MKNKSPTLTEIRKTWWWRRKEICRDGVSGVEWPLVEIAARNYELMRRSPNGKQFLSTYLELGWNGKTVAHQLWVTWAKFVWRQAHDPKQYFEKGWTPVHETIHRQWNLRLADTTLMKEFIKEIRVIRKSQKIRAEHPLKGKKHRGVSWRYIEILDQMQCADKKPFSDGDRHMASIARRDADKYAKQYIRALDTWRKRPNPLAGLEAMLEKENSTLDVLQQLAILAKPK